MISKEDIENLAKDIEVLLDERCDDDADLTRIFYNGQIVDRITKYSPNYIEWSHVFWEKESGEDSYFVRNFFPCKHILSISFSISIFRKLKRDEDFCNSILELFKRYKLRFIFKDSCFLTAFPLEEKEEVEYTYYEHPKIIEEFKFNF